MQEFEDRILTLEKCEVETRTHIKSIQEDIHDIKISIRELGERLFQEKNLAQSQSDLAWQGIVVELIKLAGMSIVILGSMVGVVKWMGE